jgi:hypothetical protein
MQFFIDMMREYFGTLSWNMQYYELFVVALMVIAMGLVTALLIKQNWGLFGLLCAYIVPDTLYRAIGGFSSSQAKVGIFLYVCTLVTLFGLLVLLVWYMGFKKSQSNLVRLFGGLAILFRILSLPYFYFILKPLFTSTAVDILLVLYRVICCAPGICILLMLLAYMRISYAHKNEAEKQTEAVDVVDYWKDDV